MNYYSLEVDQAEQPEDAASRYHYHSIHTAAHLRQGHLLGQFRCHS
jgi:hypothetical protein